jgi:AraC-like DNA-binding protein
MLPGMGNDIKAVLGLLKARLAGLTPELGVNPTAIEGVALYRYHKDMVLSCFNEPCIALVVSGNKRVMAADEEFRYHEGMYIAYGMDLPAVSNIMGATPENPYLGLLVPLDRYILSQLAADFPASGRKVYKGVVAAAVSADVLDACLRLVNLLETPERISIMAPLIIREIHFLLLAGPEGEFFRMLGTHQTPNHRIALAVSWLRSHFEEPFSLTELASHVYMSRTSFCRHFSRITGMSPLQFQKRLRLYEAQRLMMVEDKSAEAAAYEVGYESPSQFNREYKRQFGEPPHRDIELLITTEAVAGEEMGAVSLTGA